MPFHCRMWSQLYILGVQWFLWARLVSALTSVCLGEHIPPRLSPRDQCCRFMLVTQSCGAWVLCLWCPAGVESALSWAAPICWVVEKLCRVWSGQWGNWLDQGNAMVYWIVNNVERIPSSSCFQKSVIACAVPGMGSWKRVPPFSVEDLAKVCWFC